MRHAILVLMALALWACVEATGVPPPESEGRSVPSVSIPSEPDPTLLPLAWFMGRYSDPELDLVWEAYTLVVGRCMEAKGFQTPDFPDESDLVQPLRYWYGLADLEEARVDGYTGLDAAARASAALDEELSEATVAHDEQAEDSRPGDARQEAYLVALRGAEGDRVSTAVVDPITGEDRGRVGLPGGCEGEAATELFGSGDAYLTDQRTVAWLDLAIRDIRAEAERRDEVRQAAQAWLDCMSSTGFPPEHPFWPASRQIALGSAEVPDSFLGAVPAMGPYWPAFPEPRPTPEEIEMAVADVTCKRESGWTVRIFAEEYRRQDELAAAAAEFIAKGREIRAETVERARSILAGG